MICNLFPFRFDCVCTLWRICHRLSVHWCDLCVPWKPGQSCFWSSVTFQGTM